MPKQKIELNWITVQEDDIPAACRKDYDAMVAARDKAKLTIIAYARKQGALTNDETLAIAFKPYGFSMAKTVAKGAGKAVNGNVFEAL